MVMKVYCSNKKAGFTLIELLVVISILSILVATLVIAIDPAKIRRKSSETLLKATTSKICTALFSCASVKSSEDNCASYTDIGAITPSTTTGFTYGITKNSSTHIVTVSSSYTVGSSTCSYTCNFNFSSGASNNLTGTGCL